MCKNQISEIIVSHIKHGSYSNAVLLCDNSTNESLPEGIKLFYKGVAIYLAAINGVGLNTPYNNLTQIQAMDIAVKCFSTSALTYNIPEAQYNLDVLKYDLADEHTGAMPSFLRVNGIKAFYENDITSAISLLSSALIINPLDSSAHVDIAVVYIFTQEYALAKEHLERALELSPNSTSALYNLGRVYLHTQRADMAREVLLQGLSQSHNDEELLYLLGEAELELGNYTSAKTAFTRAITDKNEHVTTCANERLLFIDGLSAADINEVTPPPHKKAPQYISKYNFNGDKS